ncbi:MAG: hypothetical protein RIS09_1284, partial [Actinomycetota bacterium]
DSALSLQVVATRLSELLGQDVRFIASSIPSERTNAVIGLQSGDIALLENIRFDARETSKVESERRELARELAELADVFVSDGFGVVHRAQASVTDVATMMPSYAGFLVAREFEIFQKVVSNPERPYVVILGGSKVSDKLGVIENLLHKVDTLLIGGGMCFTFLKAQGMSVGTSLVEDDFVPQVKEFLQTASERGVKILLPTDVVIANEFSKEAESKVVAVSDIPEDWMGLDIGPESINLFTSQLDSAKTVVWNGPMGVFEFDAFAQGTRAIAQKLTEIDALTVVGGGDSAAAIRVLNLDESKFTHISTGGGASLEFLEGKVLPGLQVLEDTNA